MARSEQASNGNDQRETALRVWRLTLLKDPAQAYAAIDAAVSALKSRRVFHVCEIAQYRAQMINGVACPGEFGSGEYGGKRA